MDLYDSYPSCSLMNGDFEGLSLAFEKSLVTTTDLLVYEPIELAQKCSRSINEINRFLEIFRNEASKELVPVGIDTFREDGNFINDDKCTNKDGDKDETNSNTYSTSQQLPKHSPPIRPSPTSSQPTPFFTPHSSQPIPLNQQSPGLSTQFLTTGDKSFDDVLNGGIPIGYLTEVSGQSSTGKSNFLTQLSLTVQLEKHHGGLEKSALYISTESGVETRRLLNMYQHLKEKYPSSINLSTDNVHCYTCRSQEELVHILKYQVPLAIERFNVGIIIIDSIAAHLRAEYDRNLISQRSQELLSMTQNLHKLSSIHNLAVVIANQVSDRFPRQIPAHVDLDPLFLDNQVRWFTGWDTPSIKILEPNKRLQRSQPTKQLQHTQQPQPPIQRPFSQSSPSPTETPKIPFLGLIWSNCIDQRLVLKRDFNYDGTVNRTFNIVFSPFSPPSTTNFEITHSGVYSIPD